jgi:hypothetical protein
MEPIPVAARLLLLVSLGCTAELGPGSSPGAGSGGSTGTGASSTSGEGAGAQATTGGSSTTAMGIDLPGEPKYYRFVRLTNSQWAHSVSDILRLTQPSGLEAGFQSPVAGTTDFANNELLLDVNQRAWADYQAAAEKLAAQVTASDAALAALYAGSDAPGFIRSVGRRAYRRALTDAEIASYTLLFQSGTTLAGSRSAFAKGASLVLRALLQSPHFLYRTELSADGAELSGYELAARLSLWLADTTPSDAVIDAAEQLTTAQGRQELASALMSAPAALSVMREFHRELLHFDRYSQISKVGVPAYNESLNAEYEASAYAFFDAIFSQRRGLREILTSTRGFVGPGMAALYGLAPVGSGLVEQELGPGRAGYFAQLPYLTLNAFNAEPDSIHRGVSLNLDVLCAPLGPPAAVIPPVPPLQPGQTNRQRITTLTTGCGGVCHNALINPLGFAFEHFDGMGQYRDSENGLTIDSSGSYAFAEGEQQFADAAALMRVMAESQQAHLCYAKKLASFGLQRDVVPSDLSWLTTVAQTSQASPGSIQQTLLALIETKAFRTHLRGTP